MQGGYVPFWSDCGERHAFCIPTRPQAMKTIAAQRCIETALIELGELEQADYENRADRTACRKLPAEALRRYRTDRLIPYRRAGPAGARRHPVRERRFRDRVAPGSVCAPGPAARCQDPGRGSLPCHDAR